MPASYFLQNFIYLFLFIFECSFTRFMLVAMILISCSGTENDNSKAGSQKFPIETDKNLHFELPRTTHVNKIIYLETSDSVLISHVEKMWVAKDDTNDIFIFDSRQKKIFIYDDIGYIRAVFDKNGSGPGQYGEMRDVFLDFERNEILILDNKRIKIYHLESFDYLGNKELNGIPGDNNFTRFIKLKDVYYLWTNIPYSQLPNLTLQNQKEKFHLVRLANDTIEFFIQHKYGVLNEIRFYPSVADEVYFISPIIGKNDLQFVTEAGVFPKYEFPFTAKVVPPELLQEMFNLENEFLISDYFKILTNFRETDRFLYFNFIGPEAKVFQGLFEKSNSKFLTVGKSLEYMPQVIYADQNYFYSFIFPEYLFFLLENKRVDLTNILLGSVDLQRIKVDDNPIIVKFSIEE